MRRTWCVAGAAAAALDEARAGAIESMAHASTAAITPPRVDALSIIAASRSRLLLGATADLRDPEHLVM
jgi:hypothetical protein